MHFFFLHSSVDWVAHTLARMSDSTTIQLYGRVYLCVHFFSSSFDLWADGDHTPDREKKARKKEMDRQKSHMNYDLFSIFNIYVDGVRALFTIK